MAELAFQLGDRARQIKEGILLVRGVVGNGHRVDVPCECPQPTIHRRAVSKEAGDGTVSDCSVPCYIVTSGH